MEEAIEVKEVVVEADMEILGAPQDSLMARQVGADIVTSKEMASRTANLH